MTQKHPTFDSDGYPTEETERAISNWDYNDPVGWLEYVNEAWDHHYGRMWEDENFVKLATGGWSGNESIIEAMKKHPVLWIFLWESSHRGGLEIITNPKK